MVRCGRSLFVLAALCWLAGCHSQMQRDRSLLLPARMGPDSVALDIIFVRCPVGERRFEADLWEEIDEQVLPALLRQRLGQNGFRAGVVAGQVPRVLAELMDLTDQAPAHSQVQQVELASAESEPRAMCRHMQLAAARRGEVLASDVYDTLPLLIWREGELAGQTLHQAQAVLALKAFPQPGGRVRLELVPEVHHGQPRQSWVARDGMFLLEATRPREVFDWLQVAVDLAPGDMLLLSSLPTRPGSLGHYFFAAGEGKAEHKLLLVRLAQTQQDELTSELDPRAATGSTTRAGWPDELTSELDPRPEAARPLQPATGRAAPPPGH